VTVKENDARGIAAQLQEEGVERLDGEEGTARLVTPRSLDPRWHDQPLLL